MISSLELAKLCGVSQGTVDRALHGRSGIKPETCRRILEMARSAGYVPNPAARELMTGKSCLVGAVVPSFSTIFFMDMMAELNRALAAAGLRLMLTSVTDSEEFLQVLEEFASRRMLAAVVVPPQENLVIPARVTKKTRVVSLLSPCLGEEDADNILFLAPDERDTGLTAVRALAKLGHRRILHFTYSWPSLPIRQREAGYIQGMTELGEATVLLHHPVAPGELVRTVREQRLTAIFCHNDRLAITVIRELEAAGLRVPQGVAVLGVDDSPTFTDLWPGLSSMAYPRNEIAAKAADWITGGPTPAPVSGCTIVPGKTC